MHGKTSDNAEAEDLAPEYQYLWSLHYIDTPIARYENDNPQGTPADDRCDDRWAYDQYDGPDGPAEQRTSTHCPAALWASGIGVWHPARTSTNV